MGVVSLVRRLIGHIPKNILAGIAFLLIGISLPLFITVKTFDIYGLIAASIVSDDSGALAIAAFLLVLLNSLRALPIYLGTFLIGSSITHNKWLFRFGAPVLIWLEYSFIGQIYNLSYDFGIPSLLVILIIYVLDSLNLYNVTTTKHSVVLISMLIGVQFLDVVPALTPYGFGRGIVSMDIKTAARLIDRYRVLTVSSLGMMAFFIIMALLMGLLLRDQHKLLIAAQRLSEAELRSLEDRRNAEIHSLVHDLKTPLTTIQGLAGVIALISDDDQIGEYADQIIRSGDNISEMVSQIVNDKQMQTIPLAELFDYVRSQIVSSDMRKAIFMEQPPERHVHVNKILFSRALVNLINNAYAAIHKENGQIWVLARALPDGWIEITIDDNGHGISEKDMKKVWNIGFSAHKSTGLGLNFVRNVVSDSGGTIAIESKEGEGTVVSIRIREVASDARG